MKRILAILLAVTLLLCGCGAAKETEETTPVLENGAVAGTGSVSFALSIVDLEGNQTDVTIKTDKETVGEALQELKIISGKDGDYGLFIDTVNGITVDYNKYGAYWAFYVDGEYAMESADLTKINPESVYMLKAESSTFE